MIVLNNKKSRKPLILQGFTGFCLWQGQKESNPRHTDLESVALPAELYPYDSYIISYPRRFVK